MHATDMIRSTDEGHVRLLQGLLVSVLLLVLLK